mmetsp:Transcript_18300/g.25817  ORF Transcript_18300/g.25817 Transcript_18300/m.25817 type:complete len:236 (+) Transcript_18300:300-1007(+)
MVKSNSIDRVCCRILTMTFECKCEILRIGFRKALYSYPSFYTSNGISRKVRETSNTPCLMFQLTFITTLLHGLSRNVINFHLSVGTCNHQEISFRVHIVTSFGKIERSYGILLSCIPKFEFFVPSSRYHELGAVEECHRSYGCIVYSYLLWNGIGCGRLLAQLPHSHGFVCSGGKDCGSIRGESGCEYRCISLVIDLRLGHRHDLSLRLLYLPTPHTTIPIRTDKVVAGGRPSQR